MNWREILKAEVAKRNKNGRGGKAIVAGLIGVSRSAVSLLLAGKYPARSEQRMAARVMAKLGQGHVDCPHLQAPISIPDCGSWRKKPMPRSNPADIAHWAACRSCPVGKALAEGRADIVPPSREPPHQPSRAGDPVKAGGTNAG